MAPPIESTGAGNGNGDSNVIILSRPSRGSGGGGGRRGRRGNQAQALAAPTSSPASADIVAGGDYVGKKSSAAPDASRSLDTLETFESSSATAVSLLHESADDILLGAPAILSTTGAALSSSSAPDTSMAEPAVTILSAPTNRPGRRRRQHQQPRRSSLHKVPTSQKKTVSFQTDEDGGCLCSFHEIAGVSDMSPEEIAMVWYSEDDLDDMQEDVADILEIIAGNAATRRNTCSDGDGKGVDDATVDDDNNPDTRGLEGMRTPSERQDLQAARELNWDAVLDEQDRQWDVIDANGGVDEWGETFNGCQLMDPEKMGDIARKSSQKCVMMAQELGKIDAEYVRTKVRQEAEAREAPTLVLDKKPVELFSPAPLPGPPSNRLATRSFSSGEGAVGQAAPGTASRRGGGIRSGAAGAALRRRTRQSFNGTTGLPSRPVNQPLRRVQSGGDVPDSLSDMVDALDGRGNDSDAPRTVSGGASRSRPINNTATGSRAENASKKSTINSRNHRNNTLQGLRSARQMERMGESRRVLAKGGSFRVAAPTSGDASPRRISGKASTQTKQAAVDITTINKRKVRKGRLRKPKSRADNIKKLLGSSNGDANRNAKDTVPSSLQTYNSKGMTHLLKEKNKKTQANSSKNRGAYDFAPLAA